MTDTRNQNSAAQEIIPNRQSSLGNNQTANYEQNDYWNQEMAERNRFLFYESQKQFIPQETRDIMYQPVSDSSCYQPQYSESFFQQKDARFHPYFQSNNSSLVFSQQTLPMEMTLVANQNLNPLMHAKTQQMKSVIDSRKVEKDKEEFQQHLKYQIKDHLGRIEEEVLKAVPRVAEETIPQSLNSYLPQKVQEELDRVLFDIKLMVEINELHVEKREIVQEVMERLGTKVILELPQRAIEKISEYVDAEFSKQDLFRNDYCEFVENELAESRYSYVQSVQNMRNMVWEFQIQLAETLDQCVEDLNAQWEQEQELWINQAYTRDFGVGFTDGELAKKQNFSFFEQSQRSAETRRKSTSQDIRKKARNHISTEKKDVKKIKRKYVWKTERKPKYDLKTTESLEETQMMTLLSQSQAVEETPKRKQFFSRIVLSETELENEKNFWEHKPILEIYDDELVDQFKRATGNLSESSIVNHSKRDLK